ncbi:MAG TPA: ATP-binding protein, partial [Candidatus Thermoplasmatota archaeon]|nr:ATP-binding protein [Candidatus Thermoplasmatota archaeon]
MGVSLSDQILLAMPQAALVTDPEGRVVQVNAAAERLFGWGTPSPIGRPLEEATGIQLALPTAGSASPQPLQEAQARHASGSPFTAAISLAPLRAPDGGLAGTLLFVEDLTRQKEIEALLSSSRAALVRAEKLAVAGSLVSGVAHEVRTPLAYMSNHLYLLRMRLSQAARDGRLAADLEPPLLAGVEASLEGVERINRLVLQLRRLVRAESAARVRAPLEGVVGEAVALFQATFAFPVRVELALAPTAPVLMDPARIQQIVLNLLQNAAEASRFQGTPVRIRTGPAPDGSREVVLSVEDQGTGIPEEVRERLFEPLVTTKQEGTGLGLAIVRRAVEDHGGRILWESEPGKGTR